MKREHGPGTMTATLTNREIADVFYAIADTMEVLGEDVFRTRAYRRAGEAHFQQRFVGVRGLLHRGRRAHHLAEARDFIVLSD